MKLTSFSPLAILIGLLASQALAACLAFALVICFLFIHGSSVMVALLEYPSSIALTLLIGLLATAFGGYVAMLTPKRALINAICVGLLTLVLNIALWIMTDYRYAADQPMLLGLAALLTVPAALLGGALYRYQNTERQR